ncbi:MAG: WbqC family protein [Bacteroidaceae bacterium]|nr:WbqC family protein [Bacteroidaceae bacterium]
MNTLYLNTAYWAPVSYYTAMYRHGGAVIEQYDSYIKQTYRNRCKIVAAQGVQLLTVPVEKPSTPHALMRDIRISDHGNWRHLHASAIASAYGSSPFYEYYADDINHFYEQRYDFLLDYNMAQIECVCSWLGIELDVVRSESFVERDTTNIVDLRDAIHPKHPNESLIAPYVPQPYYQVFAAKHGFVADASILDLLCNMGNEALLVLAGRR